MAKGWWLQISPPRPPQNEDEERKRGAQTEWKAPPAERLGAVKGGDSEGRVSQAEHRRPSIAGRLSELAEYRRPASRSAEYRRRDWEGGLCRPTARAAVAARVLFGVVVLNRVVLLL